MLLTLDASSDFKRWERLMADGTVVLFSPWLSVVCLVLASPVLTSCHWPIQLFPANLGGSACSSEIVQAFSAVQRAFRRLFGHDSAGRLSKLAALLPDSMQIVHNWSEKGAPRGGKTFIERPWHTMCSVPSSPRMWLKNVVDR